MQINFLADVKGEGAGATAWPAVNIEQQNSLTAALCFGGLESLAA